MTPEENAKLDRAIALAEENNSLLRGLKRSGNVSLWLRIGYWVVIILLSVGASYFFQSYLSALTGGAFGSTDQNGSSTQASSSSKELQMLRDLLK